MMAQCDDKCVSIGPQRVKAMKCEPDSNSWLRDFEILRDDAPRMRSQYVPAIGVSLTY